MKNAFKLGIVALAISASMVACKGSGSKTATDSTAKMDSMKTDSSAKMDSVKKDSSKMTKMADTTKMMKKDTTKKKM